MLFYDNQAVFSHFNQIMFSEFVIGVHVIVIVTGTVISSVRYSTQKDDTRHHS